MESKPTEKELKKRSDLYFKKVKEENWPNFMGSNYHCGKNMFERYDGTRLITSCPFCHKSFTN